MEDENEYDQSFSEAKNHSEENPSNIKWECEIDVQPLINKLKNEEKVGTRSFLRAMYKLRKAGGDRTNKKMLAYAEWMAQLQLVGDAGLEIPPQPQLQPSFAFKTIIQHAKRMKSAEQVTFACQAYSRMKSLGFVPDSFCATAMMDMLGSEGNLEEAMDAYEDGKRTGNKPTVLTFITAMKVAADNGDLAKSLIILDEAESFLLSEINFEKKGTPVTVEDIAPVEDNTAILLYCAALRGCITAKQPLVARQILLKMKQARVKHWKYSFALIKMLNTLLQEDNPDNKQPISNTFLEWQAEGILEADTIEECLKDRKLSTSPLHYFGVGSSYTLNNVILQDLDSLVIRISNGESEQVSRLDYENLIHLCRKRKWKQQTQNSRYITRLTEMIRTILEHMIQIGQEGINNDVACIEPQPQLLPNPNTIHVVVEAYLNLGNVEAALELLDDLKTWNLDGVEPEYETYALLIKGCICRKSPCFAAKAYWEMRNENLHADSLLAEGMMRGFGASTALSLEILGDILHHSGNIASSNNAAKLVAKRHLCLLLLESCAVLNEVPGFLETLVFLRNIDTSVSSPESQKYLQNKEPLEKAGNGKTLGSGPGFGIFGSSDLTCLMLTLASHCTSIDEGLDLLHKFEQQGFLIAHPVLWSLFVEAVASCSTENFQTPKGSKRLNELNERALPFGQFYREGRVRLLHDRKDFLKRGFAHIESTVQTQESYTITSWSRKSVLDIYCTRIEFGVYFLVHHVYSCWLLLRDKGDKEKLEEDIAASLLSCPKCDRLQFIFDSFDYFWLLNLNSKIKSKVCSIILSSLNKTMPLANQEAPILQRIEAKKMSFYLLKELTKYLDFKSNDKHSLKRAVAGAALRSGAEPSKITSYLRANKFMEYVDVGALVDLIANTLITNASISSAATLVGPYEALQKGVIRRLLSVGQKDLAVRCICRFKLGNDAEFERHLSAPSVELLGGFCPKQNLAFPCFKLPMPEHHVIIVDRLQQLNIAREVLLEGTCQAIGLDVEWRPFSSNQQATKCCLLQVACESHVFLFDLIALERWPDYDRAVSGEERQAYIEIISNLFSSNSITKLGYGFLNDLDRLAWSYPSSPCYQETVCGLVDLQHSHQHKLNSAKESIIGGLSGLSEHFLRKSIDKRMQISDWEARPLSKAQIEYAAIDAFCLVEIFKCFGEDQQTTY